ncbi:voltage-dependent calcium channel subunit alpha-2/delta-3 isoform X5 [Hyposmocoma kahamanoa]|uniref:voltage-dependent calcium channel subunit alpha-2/delta-3 isoform X5 n=1 Tax=Hyposmocoma kahamanoa TaxID=1477025 RepID=UPI000E6D68EB|nr:voltage-dependent calcium channel subunit alpha-2/delta-3 isoform X5 [Hyposmocoma kahamanoa]
MYQRAGTLVFLLLLALESRYCSSSTQNEPKISLTSVQAWAVKLGTEVYHFGEFITRKKEVQDSYKSAQIESRDGEKLVQSMADDIRAMMELKVSAVKRIVEAAENMAFDKQNEPVPDDFQFYNSKEMDEPYDFTFTTTTAEPEFVMEHWINRPPSKSAHLVQNAHFSNIPVNVNFSSVHVPSNVYAWANETIKGIRWSEGLDAHFKDNYQSDPTLSWQYFGSSTGFMRHYPAMKWRAEPVDIYDCRTRAWYMEAAASPKDVVILVDRSGSMTGQRRDIAKHVVTNILDTLGNNDFVNVLTFANTVEEIVPCFAESLVQATLSNLRELKLALDSFETNEIANFSAALTKAFELLEIYRNNSGGANCNQAIMLVTDGVPYNYKEIFEKFNWKYDTPVRVFTYLIGREVKVADVREVKWMACANRGYYVHLSTLAEVREQVLEHVNVLARPLVLQREKHPVVWTPVYANITDPKVADYLWEQRERAEQKERFMSQRRDKALFNSEKEQDRRWKITQMKQGQYSEIGNSVYQLMTSVSMPVYDLRHNENITENVLINEAYWVSVTKESVEENGQREMRIARLLGVAGTDVPLSEIQALMTPYKIGVNGYAFMVTNNGYILIHPDLRPVFQGILKPSYNSVDMVEVELFDDDRKPREFSKELTALRQDIIDQKTGNKIMNVKYHMEDMRRVSRAKRHYFWTGISDSPFTLVVAIPENYGRHRITPPPTDDIHRLSLTSKNVSAKQYLSDKWSIHPDWLYCRHYERTFKSPEEELSYFLERVAKPGWRWPAKPRPPEHHKNKGHERHNNGTPETRERTKVLNNTPRNEYYCDHGLMQALVYDARNTAWFNKSISESASEEKAAEFIQRFGYIVAFLATHSGLTRWQTHPPKENSSENDKPEFGKQYPRAIDEVWYRRAVEQHYIDPLSYVYSVDLNTDKFPLNVNTATITAAHAVFHGDSHKKAPAAVVGFQFKHERLQEWFENITSSCEHKVCTTCDSVNWECYLVDSNAWVVVSKNINHTGQFFGRVRPDVLKKLVDEDVFRAVHVVDYQAVCFREKKTTNFGAMLKTPLENLRLIVTWFLTTTAWLLNSVATVTGQASSYSFDDEYVTPTAYQNYEGDDDLDEGDMSNKPASKAVERDFEKLVLINRTRPTPCDREMYVYQLEYNNLDEKLNKPLNDCKRPFYVQLVNYTNMLLVVVDGLCPVEEVTVPGVEPTEVNYNESLPCLKHAKPLYRKQPASCIRNHTEESNIDMCGRGTLPTGNLFWISSVIFFVFKYWV